MSAVLQVAGLVLVSLACWMLLPWLGVFAAGVCCLLVGLALERSE